LPRLETLRDIAAVSIVAYHAPVAPPPLKLANGECGDRQNSKP